MIWIENDNVHDCGICKTAKYPENVDYILKFDMTTQTMSYIVKPKKVKKPKNVKWLLVNHKKKEMNEK